MKNNLHSPKHPVSFTVIQQEPRSNTTRALVSVQPLEERIWTEWEEFLAQAHRINQIAEELETAIFELKQKASIINSLRRFRLPAGKKCQDICEYSTLSIPCVGKKADGSFVLATQKIDLFRAEKEAELLAQKLRQQTKKMTTLQDRRVVTRS
jgi:hypothetical protein